MKLSQLEQRKAQHVVVFGDPGTGKSTLASKLSEEGYNLLWISIDNGHTVLYKLSPDARDRIEILVLPDTKEFPVGIATCLKLVSGAALKICDNHGQVNCSSCTKVGVGATWTDVCLGKLGLDTIVVFDNISQLADSAMNFICDKKPDDFKPGYDEFRLQGTLMNKFLTNIQQAPYHVLCIAHVCETEMEDSSKKLVPLVGTVPFSRNSGKYFDHMIYCRVMNKAHRFGSATTYMSGVISKSRTDVEIEKQAERQESLVPFFSGEIKAAEKNGAVSAQAAMQKFQAGGKATAGDKPALAVVPTENSHDAPVPQTASVKELLAQMNLRGKK
jgi:hypothetical protein